MMGIERENVLKCLSFVSQFCSQYSELCNSHTVDFIVKDRWCILPSELRDELSRLDIEDLKEVFCQSGDDFKLRNCPNLCSFIENARKNTLAAMADTLPKCPVIPLSVEKMSTVVTSSFLITPKKSHEVQAMAHVVSALSEEYNINSVVDFGSGKGYLSSHLSLNHGLDSLALDSSETNCQAAGTRNSKLACHNRHLKLKHHKLMQDQITNSTEDNDSSEDIPSNGTFVCNKLQITETTDLSGIISKFANNRTPDCLGIDETRAIFVGLHTCGNLQPSMLKQFLATPKAKVLCSVGCCYQHVQEQFVQDPFLSDVQEYGFPLSDILLKSKCGIGRNARMLASQSPERLSQKNDVQNKPLFYRALLQVILQDYVVDLKPDYRIGKLGSKCKNFVEYVQRSIFKLGLNIQLSEEKCNLYMEQYSGYEKKLYAFQLLRVLMSSCIEALILLDRLAFLLEQGEIQDAYLCRLFDPVISPRCFALIATKNL